MFLNLKEIIKYNYITRKEINNITLSDARVIIATFEPKFLRSINFDTPESLIKAKARKILRNDNKRKNNKTS